MKESTKIFLESERIESEFYNTSKDNLISLKEFFEAFKKVDEKFESLISDEAESIKKKVDWVERISFNGYQDTINDQFYHIAIHLYTKDDDELIAVRDKKTGLYEDNLQDLPKLYLLSPKMRKHNERKKELNKIQPELRKIETIGRSVYKNLLGTKSSVSGDFQIDYRPGLGMLVTTGYDTVATFYEKETKFKERIYLKPKTKNKILTRIQLKGRDLPSVNE